MCESAIYLVEGSEKTLVMAEAARVIADPSAITCINAYGERKMVEDAVIAEADLTRHEIIVRKRPS